MSFVSYEFIALVFLTALIYYLVPGRFRYLVLLIASVFFYSRSGWILTLLVLATTLVCYIGGILIDRARNVKRRARTVTAVSVILILAILIYVKVGRFLRFDGAYLLVPIGISYYSLSMIGYLLDVYWKRDSVEKNFLHLATFVLFFPKIIQGPISQYKNVRENLLDGNHFDWDGFCFGIQLAIWGYFKKLVIADRLSTAVSQIYDNLDIYESNGTLLFCVMILSALQLYMDFSGYTDIARGVSEMYGVELEVNFNRPFFSRSAAGFWRRWHMTLSGWFKDYLFLPLSRTRLVKNTSKKIGTRWGNIARKKSSVVMCSAVVWLVTGLWHGTGVNYIVWGVYWGTIIIAAEVFERQLVGLREILHIKENNPIFVVFQMLRTSLIFIFGKMISAQDNLTDVKTILHSIVWNQNGISWDSLWETLGLTEFDYKCVLLGLFIVLFVSILQERGHRIREEISSWNPILRWFTYSAALSLVLLLGCFGGTSYTSEFAYQIF